jgi:adenine-specific DNA glycosylase
VRVATVVVRDRREVWLLKQPATAARWAGLWTFPHVERGAREASKTAAQRAARELLGLDVTVDARIASFEHTITRFRIAVEAFEARPSAEQTSRAGRAAHVARAPLEDLESFAMPTPHRKLARLLARAKEQA